MSRVEAFSKVPTAKAGALSSPSSFLLQGSIKDLQDACGHPQQTQIGGGVPTGVGLVGASLTGEVLAPAHTRTAVARAGLARIVQLHDHDGNAAMLAVYSTKVRSRKKLQPEWSLRTAFATIVRPRMQVFAADPSTHLNRISDETNRRSKRRINDPESHPAAVSRIFTPCPR
jgi:hypothetical protein